MIDHHTALIYTMVLVSASDRDMTDIELKTMGDLVKQLPIFRDYDESKLPASAQECAKLLGDENGLDKAIGMIRDGLPDKLRDTAYALACDVAAADGRATQEELRLLEMLRYGLEVTRLKAAAIEHGARARHMTL
ncbi:MAG: tellurite resistance TerB family protein [Kiloniellales bacterium]|nr:tellurite resistance TerB family protein [Kiloniellales bacterium]